MVYLRTVLPIQVSNPLPIDPSTPKERVSEVVLQTSLVGLLNQISLLAVHANDIFSAVLQETSAITARVSAATSRCANIQNSLPSLESHYKSTSLEQMHATYRADFHAAFGEKNQLFTPENVPAYVKRTYDVCKPPPNLSLLDGFMEDGKKALKMYTDPQFFLDEWVAEQARLKEEAKQRRRERREARLKRKAEKGGDTAAAAPKKVKQIRRVRYDPVTGEKIVEMEDATEGTLTPSSSGGSHPAARPASVNYVAAPASSTYSGTPAPPPSSDFYASPPPPPMGGGFSSPPPPPPHMGGGGYSAPPPPPHMGGSSGFASPPPPPPHMGSSGGYSAPAPPLPPSGGPAPPPPPPPPPSAPTPPPPPPMSGGGGGGGSLLDALSGPRQLNAVQAKAKPVDTQSDLLASIRAGKSLKTVSATPVAAKSTDPPQGSVAAILQSRIRAAVADSDDEDDDDDSDWDDE